MAVQDSHTHLNTYYVCTNAHKLLLGHSAIFCAYFLSLPLPKSIESLTIELVSVQILHKNVERKSLTAIIGENALAGSKSQCHRYVCKVCWISMWFAAAACVCVCASAKFLHVFFPLRNHSHHSHMLNRNHIMIPPPQHIHNTNKQSQSQWTCQKLVEKEHTQPIQYLPYAHVSFAKAGFLKIYMFIVCVFFVSFI